MKESRTSLPQIVPHWPVNDSELKPQKTQKTREELFTSPLTASKNLDTGPDPGRKLSPGIITKSRVN